MSKQLQKELEKFIEQLGATKNQETGYTHVIESRIGPLYLRVDTEGSIVSIFGNFLDCADRARQEFGHWKYNFHLFKTEKNIKDSIKYHIEKVK